MDRLPLKNFHDVEFDGSALPMIVVYDHPLDYPDYYVARIWYVIPRQGATATVHATEMFMIADSMEGIHTGIPGRFIELPRLPQEPDPKIIETWI